MENGKESSFLETRLILSPNPVYCHKNKAAFMKFDLGEFKRQDGHVHFIGCAGAGTHPLASIFIELGFPCSGSDLLPAEIEGMRVFQGHAAENLPKGDFPLLLVHTSAAAPDNPELVEAERRGAAVMRRGEALAHLGTLFERSIAVAGSHGKTSVSAMTAHTLTELGLDPGFLIGGNVSGWTTSGRAGNGKLCVTEVDESDSTNALFHASTAVVTNIEDDHSWSVGGTDALFGSFVTFGKNAEHLIFVEGENTDRLLAPLSVSSERIPRTRPGWDFPAHWGGFQKLNAVTAFAAVRSAVDCSDDEIRAALFRFPGVERRMSLRFDNGTFRIVEDYAHHPTELKASLSALRETNPGRRMTVVFQPHRYARLKRYLPEFAALLKTVDGPVFLSPVFAAWTDKSDVDSGTLAATVGKNAHAVSGTWESMAETVAEHVRPGDLIAVIGAGDVKEIIDPLSRLLKSR